LASNSHDNNQHSPTSPLRAVIVGGSLVGLSTAIALARHDISVIVLERTGTTDYPGGGGLGVDLGLLAQVTGLPGHPPICQGTDRATTAWPLLVAWLERHARSLPNIEIVRAAEVVEVNDGWARTASGQHYDADLIIGADGARSTVRRWVAPERPDAVYAGYLLWRAMVPEADLSAEVIQLPANEPSREYYSGPYRLVTYPVPGPDGSALPGRRRLNLVWYDPARSELLAGRGLLDGTTVHGSLAASDVPGPLRDELRAVAGQRWPSPWRDALDVALRHSLIFATPVVQYPPLRLTRGRVVIVGDAAHAASPMVGGGFRHGLYDAAALASTFHEPNAHDIAQCLDIYQGRRLKSAQDHVERSEEASAAYLSLQNRS
jgi:2-polyprenyl-6-methoxyphenol hydroxylase-like FAD-dependent oxidoreductase